MFQTKDEVFVDKLYAERLNMPEPEIVFEERTATEYEYNFSHSLIDADKLPISILKKMLKRSN